MSQSTDRDVSAETQSSDGLNRRNALKLAALGLFAGSAIGGKDATAQGVPVASKTPTKSVCSWDHEGKLGPSVRADAKGFLPGRSQPLLLST